MAPRLSAPVLLLHDEPELYQARLESRFPELAFEACRQGRELPEMLRRLKPRVAFTIKCTGAPGPSHAPLVGADGPEWVHVGGSGYDHMPPWDPARLTVTNGAGVLAPYLAETVIGAMLMMNFGFPAYIRHQPRGRWELEPWRPLAGQRLLIVGLGRIGREVAARAKALGMEVAAVKRVPDPEPGFDTLFGPERLREALATADVVSLHLRLNAETEGLFDASAFAAMKPGARFINTSRGPVVETPALLAALDSGHLAGAYLDVFEQEPLPPSSPLWRHEKVVISPHVADQITGWQARFADHFADNLDRWLRGEALENLVAPPLRPQGAA